MFSCSISQVLLLKWLLLDIAKSLLFAMAITLMNMMKKKEEEEEECVKSVQVLQVVKVSKDIKNSVQ